MTLCEKHRKLVPNSGSEYSREEGGAAGGLDLGKSDLCLRLGSGLGSGQG